MSAFSLMCYKGKVEASLTLTQQENPHQTTFSRTDRAQRRERNILGNKELVARTLQCTLEKQSSLAKCLMKILTENLNSEQIETNKTDFFKMAIPVRNHVGDRSEDNREP